MSTLGYSSPWTAIRMYDCILVGGIYTTGAVNCYNCTFVSAVFHPSDGSGNLHNCSGKVTLENLTTDGWKIYLSNGEVNLASSCTGGVITLYGTHRLVDNSNGATVNDYRGDC